jgi:hypothetical protein
MPLRRLAAPVAAALVAALLGAVPAQADESTDAPVTADDRVNVPGTAYRLVDVLANDSDPGGDQLAVCRAQVPDGVPLHVDVLSVDEGNRLLVQPLVNRSGTYRLTYWACDFDYLTPATVTVTVKAVPQVTGAVVTARPGRVRFRNPGTRPAVVVYGAPRTGQADGEVRVAAGAATVVRTTRRALFFVAYVPRTGEPLGDGYVRPIPQPRRSAR